MKKRILSILLTVCLLMGLLPVSASAASDPNNFVFDISEGTIRILDGATEGSIKVEYGNGQTTRDVSYFKEVTVTGSFTAENASTPGKSLKVETDQLVNIRIRNLTIDNNDAVYYSASGNDAYEAMVLLGNTKGKANVTLTLEGNNFLRGSRDCGGIEVGEGHTLRIQGNGTLNAQGYQAPNGYRVSSGAGIGGHVKSNCGTVIITGGTVTAKGGYGAAGIGGGFAEGSVGGNGGNIHITGGTVTATGGEDAAGIGGGSNQFGTAGHGLGGDVTITGGTVFATAGSNEADAIGGGRGLNGETERTGTLTVNGDAWVGWTGTTSTAKTLTQGVVLGVVYGNVTLTKDRTLTGGFGVLSIRENASLTIPTGKTLTMADGNNDIHVNGTLINRGTIALNSTSSVIDLTNGTLNNYGTLTGSGSITPEAKKLNYAAPPGAPEIASVSANSITLKSIPGAEYSKDRTVWQSDPTFSGLVSNTSYTFYARYASNRFYHTSTSSEEGTTQYTADNAPAVGEGFSIDYYAETITVADGYEASRRNFGTLIVTSSIEPGETIYIRKKASGSTPASPAMANKIPDRPAAPTNVAYTIDYVNETISYDETAFIVHNIVNGDIRNGGKLSPGNNYYICTSSVEGQFFESEPVYFSIPGRPAAPTDDAYIINYSSEKISFDDSIYEVNKCQIIANRPFDSDPVSNGDSVTPGGILRIRYKAVVGTSFKSEPLTVELPDRPAAPGSSVCTINYSNETISFNSSYEVNTKADFTGTDVANNGTVTPGTPLYVRRKAAGTSFASAATEVTIPARPAAPALSDVAYTVDYGNETISFDSSYEVNTKADFTGTDVANNGTVTPGTPLYVRRKAAGTSFASAATEVTIMQRPSAPSISGSYAVSTTDSTKFIYTVNSPVQDAGAYEYRMDSGAWQVDTGFDGIEPLSQHTFYARLKATASVFASAESSITVTFSKLPGDGSVTMQGWTYGEMAKEPVPSSNKNGTAHVTYSYEGINGTNYPSSTNIPTNAGEYRVTATFAATAVYQGTTATADFAINKASLTVTANDCTITYGDAPAANGVAYSGFVNNEDNRVLSGTLAYDFNYSRYGNVGSYTVTPKGLISNNYTIVFKKGTLTVEQREIGIQWDNTTLTYTGVEQKPTATATSTVNNDELTLTVTGAKTDAGTYTAAVTGIGGEKASNYKLPEATTTEFTITKAAQDAPAAPVVKSKTWNSVTLEMIPDNANGVKAQYSKDSGTTWQDSPEFTGLWAGTEYHFAARYGETDNYAASPVSEPLAVTTNNAPVSTYPPVVEQPEEGGSVTVSPKNPTAGSKVTITPKPDEGYEVDDVIVTDQNGNAVEVINNGDGTYSFTQPAGKVDIEITFMEDNTMQISFADVPAKSYYSDAVQWAVENGITTGTSDTTFAPDAPCTRAQIVTFLWRAAGSPEPKNLSSLSDVPADAYYAKAVAWALENGITTGTGNGMFSPDATCTRAQTMTFIYRSEQAQGGGMQGAGVFQNPFSDVDLENYYGGAIMWAVANGITNGTSDTTFSPGTDCTRAQIVTFLWRALAE